MKSFVEFCNNDIPEIDLKEIVNTTNKIDFDDISKELYNRCQLYRNSYVLCEGDGIAKGCVKLAIAIDKAIKKIFDTDKLTIVQPFKGNISSDIISNFDFYKFIDSLDIEIKKSVKLYKDFIGDGEYNQIIADEFWSDENKKFLVGNIKITLPQDFYENEISCTDIICHELNHIAQDWYRRQKEGKSMKLDKESQKEYIKLKQLSNTNIIQSYMKKEECNSYIAQIEGELQNKNFDYFEDAINWLDKHSNVWKGYKALKKLYEENNNKELKKLFHKNWGKFLNHLFHLLKRYVKNDYKITEKAYRKFNFDFLKIPEINL